MPITPWKVLESKYIHPRFRIDQCELPNGNSLEAMILEFRSWANILPVTRDHQAVLIRQYRHGVREVMWEIPGGVVEEGEDPLEGARREMLEETGYASSKIIQVGKCYPNPAFQTNTLYCFLALDAEQVTEQALDGAEEIEIHLLPVERILPMIRNGEFLHALQVVALIHALTELEKLG